MRTGPISSVHTVSDDVETLPSLAPVQPASRAQPRTRIAPFILFIALLAVVRSIVIDWNQVPTASMSPTIEVGDHIVVDKLAYGLRLPFTHTTVWERHDPARGEIVAFTSPADGTLYVKRVIGTPGDTVALIDDVLVINGEAARFSATGSSGGKLAMSEWLGAHEHLIALDETGSADNFGPLVVPPDAYLLMGDNRHQSFDSRHFGFVDRDRILGRATTVAFSLDYDQGFQPRADRLLLTLR